VLGESGGSCTVIDSGQKPRVDLGEAHMKISRSLNAATLDLNMIASMRPFAYSPVPTSHTCRRGSSGGNPYVQVGAKAVKTCAAFVFSPLSVLSWRFDPTPGRSTTIGIFRLSSSAFGLIPLRLRRIEDIFGDNYVFLGKRLQFCVFETGVEPRIRTVHSLPGKELHARYSEIFTV
jgi:hypothetical protein